MLIDTHAHVNFNAFKKDADEVIRRSLDNGVWMINVGSQYSTSARAVEMAERYEKGVYAAVGIHPIHLSEGIFKTKIDQEEIEFKTREERFVKDDYRKLASSKKVVAIGEIGLDYWYRPKTEKKMNEMKDLQRQTLMEQIALAKELNLPVIFHCRAAHDEMISILENERGLRGVLHCFTGTWAEAQKYLEMGFYIGFNGIIFKFNAEETIKNIPLERMVLETDCPYLTPPQEAGKRNEPIYVKHVAEKIAGIRNLSYEEIINITTKNAKELFGI